MMVLSEALFRMQKKYHYSEARFGKLDIRREANEVAHRLAKAAVKENPVLITISIARA